MLKEKIKVVIVDDSAFMRKSISIMLESDPSIEIVGTAKNGLEGFELVNQLKPDIVTLDIEMPVMDGLTALAKIMKTCPTSVLMVSSLTTEGAESTLKAMELGAIDFIPKELSYVNVNIIKIKEDLVKKVKEIVSHKRSTDRLNRLQKLAGYKKEKREYHSKSIPEIDYKALAIGISTGGPLALQKVIPRLSGKINLPVFIVQHMPPKFTKSLADRLNNMSQMEVKEAEDREIVRNGVVYIAPGGHHMKVKSLNGKGYVISIEDTPINSLHKPSVDVMMSSVVDIYGRKTLGLIMTGMGKDGLEAMKYLKRINGTCLAQDEASSIVYGMPKAVVDAGIIDAVLSIDEIPIKLNKVLSNERKFSRASI